MDRLVWIHQYRFILFEVLSKVTNFLDPFSQADSRSSKVLLGTTFLGRLNFTFQYMLCSPMCPHRLSDLYESFPDGVVLLIPAELFSIPDLEAT